MKALNYEQIFKLATSHRLAGQTRQSIKEYQRLLKDKDKKIRIEAWNGIALCHKMEKKHLLAINGFKRAAIIAESINRPQRLSGLYRDIAITYEYQHKYSIADRWYQKALANLREYGDKPLRANPQWGITVGKRGLMFMRWGKLKEAAQLLWEGLNVCQRSDADFYVLTLKMHFLELHNRRGQFQSTVRQAQPLIQEAKIKKWDHRLAQLLIIQGVALESLHKKKEASRNRRQIYKIIAKLDSKEMRVAVMEDRQFQYSLLKK